MNSDNSEVEPQTTFAEQGREKDVLAPNVKELWTRVRQLTIEEWAKEGIDITKMPMRKDVERLIRLKDK